MGKLIKVHLARLIVLTAATYQVGAAIQGFLWPKVLWDFISKALDRAVKPIPLLQTLNLFFGLLLLAWEWPIVPFINTSLYQSITARLFILIPATLVALLLYQATNAAIYYIISIGLYSWAYYKREVDFK
ncbi:PRO41 protein [Stipitochalara longipes BDJ]|nr:PRO41 protein [Stipitochalara longipes BDJ]